MAIVYKVEGQTIQPGKGWTDSSGIKHPRNWDVWSDDEKAARGITAIDYKPFPNEQLYDSEHNDDGSVKSTNKSLTDTNAVDKDGKAIKDADGNQVVKLGVKNTLKNEVKRQQGSLLFETDWAIIRKADKGTAVPSNIQTWRDAIRTKATAMETAIDNAANTAAIEALFKNGTLYDWPKLGS